MGCVHYIEYEGAIYDFGSPLSIKEAWFVAKNMSMNPGLGMNTTIAYAKMWSSKEKYGCSYDESFMKTVFDMELISKLGRRVH
jgi:hypothetical protein